MPDAGGLLEDVTAVFSAFGTIPKLGAVQGTMRSLTLNIISALNSINTAGANAKAAAVAAGIDTIAGGLKAKAEEVRSFHAGLIGEVRALFVGDGEPRLVAGRAGVAHNANDKLSRRAQLEGNSGGMPSCTEYCTMIAGVLVLPVHLSARSIPPHEPPPVCMPQRPRALCPN